MKRFFGWILLFTAIIMGLCSMFELYPILSVEEMRFSNVFTIVCIVLGATFVLERKEN